MSIVLPGDYFYINGQLIPGTAGTACMRIYMAWLSQAKPHLNNPNARPILFRRLTDQLRSALAFPADAVVTGVESNGVEAEGAAYREVKLKAERTGQRQQAPQSLIIPVK